VSGPVAWIAQSAACEEDVTIELHSPLAFTATLARLTEVLEGAGMTIFARVDHQAGATQVGLSMYGDALAGKVIIDISNTFNADATGLVTPDGTSGAQEIARAVPASAPVVKAFNTVFGHVLAQGRSLDVFFAGDDARAKASVSTFIESLGLRPFDVGGLAMARWLEGVGPLLMGLARHGVGNFNFALGVNLPS
jgi:predicted dinucleotide-binding enzyme